MNRRKKAGQIIDEAMDDYRAGCKYDPCPGDEVPTCRECWINRILELGAGGDGHRHWYYFFGYEPRPRVAFVMMMTLFTVCLGTMAWFIAVNVAD